LAIADRLRAELRGFEGVTVSEPGVYHCGEWVISVGTPFIFDRRLIPDRYLGVRLLSGPSALPPEFQIRDSDSEYVWAAERYEAFVDRAAEEIRAALRNPNMAREEMLDALVGGDFEEFKCRYEQAVAEGRVPPYRVRL
jgi:hypothetical protein